MNAYNFVSIIRLQMQRLRRDLHAIFESMLKFTIFEIRRSNLITLQLTLSSEPQ